MRNYKSNLIVSCHGVEQEITAELFESLIKKPREYVLFITNWDKDQLKYIADLEEIFSSNIDKIMQRKNRLKALYEAINTHYKSISKFSRTSNLFISDISQEYRKIIEKTYKEYTKFFFEDINNLSGNFVSTIEVIKSIKLELEKLPEKVINELTVDIKNILNIVKKDVPISLSLYELYEYEWKEKKQKSFDFYTNNFIDMVGKLDKLASDELIVGEFAKLFTGFEVDYWNDTHKSEFINRINGVKNKLDNYKPAKEISEKEVKLTLETSSGKDKAIVFEKSELSQISITMKNKLFSTIDKFGQSITYEEKIQVLLALLDDFLESK